MSPYYFHLVEGDRIVEACEPLPFAGRDDAIADARRQIRAMLAAELIETCIIDLRRSIRIDGPDGIAMVRFADALTIRA